MTAEHARGVTLPLAHTGSSYLHELLRRAVERFPEQLSGAALPADPQVFKQRYADALPRFEAARIESAERGEIARFLCVEGARDLRFSSEHGDVRFEEFMAEPAEPLPLVSVDLTGPGRLTPAVSFEGRLHQGARITELADELLERHLLTRAARDGVRWSVEHAEAGGLSLRGQRFVLLGAAAELAPTDLLLQAGADVLWIDVREPSVDRLLDPRLGGSLHYVRGGADLLVQPQRIAATVVEFAQRGPVHLCMYAYAGGETQEWRLTASMNAIARLLPRELVSSVAMLVSPTTPGHATSDDALTAESRRQEAPNWKRTLYRTGQLSDGFVRHGERQVARAIVPTQGASYQAAQYLGKMLAAEAYALYGNQLDPDRPAPLTVSANVAPITATRSLSHPMFEAAFLGAPLFDILISTPAVTRTLSGLLTLHDLLNPAASGAAAGVGRAERVFTRQFHGGVYAQPYALAGCIKVAALRGLTRKPGLALRLFR